VSWVLRPGDGRGHPIEVLPLRPKPEAAAETPPPAEPRQERPIDRAISADQRGSGWRISAHPAPAPVAGDIEATIPPPPQTIPADAEDEGVIS
jgi:hypothetical protein